MGKMHWIFISGTQLVTSLRSSIVVNNNNNNGTGSQAAGSVHLEWSHPESREIIISSSSEMRYGCGRSSPGLACGRQAGWVHVSDTMRVHLS